MASPRLRFAVAPLLAALLASGVLAQGSTPATPESVGMSTERLNRLTLVMQRGIDDGEVAGVVTLVARRGKIVHHEALGKRDREKNLPMTKDTIFRIASMSKAITSVAAMLLVEEGNLHLTDPVGAYLPGFRKTTVAGANGEGALPARREITIRDLLTHTAGISYGTGPLEATYKAKDVYLWYFADKNEPIVATMERLATLPFTSQPGERWVYGFATDVLGAVVEKASGQPLDVFMQTRIFEPLKMVDTAFYLPSSKAARLAAVYSAGDHGVVRAPDPARGQGDYVNGPRRSFSGGAGLLATASDYARFLQMLLNGGQLDGVRLLGPKTVQLMTANHVGGLYQEGRLGFGLGFEIVEHVGRAGRPGSVGEYSWGGAYFTRFWVDPVEEVVAVFMAQLLPAGGSLIQEEFRTLVNQAIVESDVK
jgi:CubicO group peptidase (beta-lactamase class C family)